MEERRSSKRVGLVSLVRVKPRSSEVPGAPRADRPFRIQSFHWVVLLAVIALVALALQNGRLERLADEMKDQIASLRIEQSHLQSVLEKAQAEMAALKEVALSPKGEVPQSRNLACEGREELE